MRMACIEGAGQFRQLGVPENKTVFLPWYRPIEWLVSVTLRYRRYYKIYTEWSVHLRGGLSDSFVSFDFCRRI